MFSKLLETITGKDDLERVASKGDLAQLEAHLQLRKLLVPQRPRYYLDASNLTQEDLCKMIEKESKRLDDSVFEPWILEMDGKKRLPVFSSSKAMERFSSRMSQELNKVFSLGCIDLLLKDIKTMDVDIIDLNYFSKDSWEFTIRQTS